MTWRWTVETWRKVWRIGVAPQLSTRGLEALRDALVADDPRLMQGATTTPPPMQCVLDWPVEGACPIGFCAWQGDGLETVGETEESFARVCFEADKALGELAAVRYFLNYWDDAPRVVAVYELLDEVHLELARRHGPVAAESKEVAA
jgi:hypothetical protein